MRFLLDALYVAALLLASPWLVWVAVTKGKYREGFAAKFLGRVPVRTSDGPCVWIHAVSVGEVNLIGTLIDELSRRWPELKFAISTTTMAGHAVAKDRYGQHLVFYCPLDFSWGVSAALDRVRPSALVLAELELWPNLIGLARKRGIPVAVVNGRMSERSFRGYRRLRPLVRWLLGRLSLIAVQSETYAERFRQLGARPEVVQVTGSMKFDGAETNRNNNDTVALRLVADIDESNIVLIGGSTQEPEERYLLNVYRKLSPAYPQLRLILVPRHPDRFAAVAKLLDNSGIPWQLRTNLDENSRRSTTARETTPRILLVNRMGELRAWWGMATIAFVGGSFGDREGQNMIEPAAYAATVAVGPRTRNFRDVVAMLLEADAITVVHHAVDLEHFVRRCLEHPEEAAAQGARARQVVMSQLGATRRTAELLLPLLNFDSLPPH
jgi:3-deoxy-D-manno-octulosonic-acid transferase